MNPMMSALFVNATQVQQRRRDRDRRAMPASVRRRISGRRRTD
jgi:hypothetical protein